MPPPALLVGGAPRPYPGPGASVPTTLSSDPAQIPIDLVHPIHRPDAFDDPDWVFEPMYDGLRGLLHSTSTGCEIRVAGDVQLDRLTDLCERVHAVLNGREAILDGEIVALDRAGRPVLRDLIAGRGAAAFAAFDLIQLDRQDLRALPLGERKRKLVDLLPRDTGPLYKILTIEEYGRALFEATRKLDLEGIVAKRKGDTYGPAAKWYSIRNPTYYRVSNPASRTSPAPVTKRARSEAR
jgi:bifunctional non-homologous end joining protein LigD